MTMLQEQNANTPTKGNDGIIEVERTEQGKVAQRSKTVSGG